MILNWENPGLSLSIIVWIVLEKQLQQVNQRSFDHYGKRLILNICMTLHQLFELSIFLMCWYWMQTKHHQSMYPQLMWQCLSKEQHICQSEGEMCYNSNSYSKLSGKMQHFRLFILKKLKDVFLKMLQVKKFSYFLIKALSNEVETLSLVDKIIAQYIENVKNRIFSFQMIKNLFLSEMHLKSNVLQEFKWG